MESLDPYSLTIGLILHQFDDLAERRTTRGVNHCAIWRLGAGVKWGNLSLSVVVALSDLHSIRVK